MQQPITIVEYNESLLEDFRRLSMEWIDKYLYLEPEDEKQLADPEGVIIRPGGKIFFAKVGDAVAGTASIVRYSEDPLTFEIAKMAVSEQFQGLKLGNLLMETTINAAKELGAQQIILYTNHLLTAALHLYKKYGFEQVQAETTKYIEADIKMVLNL
jgi:ribosomal protein S18 acetylase RimI-like enzyme